MKPQALLIRFRALPQEAQAGLCLAFLIGCALSAAHIFSRKSPRSISALTSPISATNTTPSTASDDTSGAEPSAPPSGVIYAAELGGFGPMDDEEIALTLSGLTLRVGALEAWTQNYTTPERQKRNGN